MSSIPPGRWCFMLTVPYGTLGTHRLQPRLQNRENVPTISDFLRARLDEDEHRFDLPDFIEDAESARSPGWGNRGPCPLCGASLFDGNEAATEIGWWNHVECVHDHARMLREVAAIRELLDCIDLLDKKLLETDHSLTSYSYGVLESLADIWSEHPEYESWAG